ncbi:MAG: hypothetical protein M3032_03775 [Verrucomicrobiota bacterium]|nr:hypothetical protein [Verrucomicrobiota bacterium]
MLVAGGGVAGEIGTAELYDPTAGTWSATGNLKIPRAFHTATLLSNGKALIAGGLANSGGMQRTAELYDPASGTWTLTGSLAAGREYHTATLLQNGKVLVAGGDYLTSAELYDPATGVWTLTGSLGTGREAHSATLLQNGKVLVAGGRKGNSLAQVEIYNPTSGTWSAAATLAAPRANHGATLLANGKVLVTAGFDYGTGRPLATAELYDPASNSWSSAGSLAAARSLHTATLLPDGGVLVAGGGTASGTAIATAQLYNPASGNWTTTAGLNTARVVHTATLLPNGHVLFAGGDSSNASALASAELYLTDGPFTTPRNISTRVRVETGDNGLIGGFYITGSVSKRVLIRALGPSLVTAGVVATLDDPTLELDRNDAGRKFNDDWQQGDTSAIPSGFAPTDPRECVIVATLAAGPHTAIVSGKDGATGIAIVEVYDLEPTAASTLSNISTCGSVQSGDNVMIGGFILGGSTNLTQVAIRGLGPSLSDAGLSDAVADPTLDLRDANGARLIANDNWQDDPDSAGQLTARGLAPKAAAEAAIFTTLPAGNYTAILASKNGTGIGLVEVYNVR